MPNLEVCHKTQAAAAIRLANQASALEPWPWPRFPLPDLRRSPRFRPASSERPEVCRDWRGWESCDLLFGGRNLPVSPSPEFLLPCLSTGFLVSPAPFSFLGSLGASFCSLGAFCSRAGGFFSTGFGAASAFSPPGRSLRLQSASAGFASSCRGFWDSPPPPARRRSRRVLSPSLRLLVVCWPSFSCLFSSFFALRSSPPRRPRSRRSRRGLVASGFGMAFGFFSLLTSCHSSSAGCSEPSSFSLSSWSSSSWSSSLSPCAGILSGDDVLALKPTKP
mmetsp:Transcript_5086/g.12028  ORF Transcript_5086/g.12028 Transcript_5086/m.12028 type:complete len:277 (-) Transcript_5086:268-1098(-)